MTVSLRSSEEVIFLNLLFEARNEQDGLRIGSNSTDYATKTVNERQMINR